MTLWGGVWPQQGVGADGREMWGLVPGIMGP